MDLIDDDGIRNFDNAEHKNRLYSPALPDQPPALEIENTLPTSPKKLTAARS